MNNFILRFLTSILFGSLFFYLIMSNVKLHSLLLILIFSIMLLKEYLPLIKPKIRKYAKLKIIIYPILPFILLLTLNYFIKNKSIIVYPYLIAWGSDTGGYIFGKLFGYHKNIFKISPNKSMEGVIGSIVFVLLINIYYISIFKSLNRIKLISLYIIISLVETIVAILGDLYISHLKRISKRKDSGNLLPGHGGLLDRFDSVLAISYLVPLIYILKYNYYV